MALLLALMIFDAVYLIVYILPWVIVICILEYLINPIPSFVYYLLVPSFLLLLYVSGMRAWFAASTYADKLSFIKAHKDSGEMLRFHLSFIPIIGKLFQRKDENQ